MEYKIGEIFEYNGDWYQCIPDTTDDKCGNCQLPGGGKACMVAGFCSSCSRIDETNVCFKKLEKYGGFIKDNIRGEICQPYTIFDIDRANSRDDRVQFSENKNDFVFVVTKQNKEDMEEKKLNLKTFDLEAAKAGKPVCTRDGRKSRIICYDRQSDHGFPLVVLVENTGAEKDEDVHFYRANGTAATAERAQDLMMAPEHHVGYINVYSHPESKSYWAENVFDTKEDAYENKRPILEGVVVVATVKIEWEEQP